MEQKKPQKKLTKKKAKKKIRKKKKVVASTSQSPQLAKKPELDTLMESPQKEQMETLPQTQPETSSKDPFVAEILEEVKEVAEVVIKSKQSGFLGIPIPSEPQEDARLTRFKEFLNTQWGLPAVTVMFRGLFAGGYPPIPVPTRWQIPSGFNLEQLVWEQVQTEKFIDEAWPSILMLLGDDICNSEWAARIATVLSFFNVIRVLPIVLEDTK